MPDHPGRIIPVTYIFIRRNHTAQTYVKVITLMFLTRLGLIGIILMCQHNTVMVFVGPLWCTIPMIRTSTCTTLMMVCQSALIVTMANIPSDSTVITLADWYHTAAELGSAFP